MSSPELNTSEVQSIVDDAEKLAKDMDHRYVTLEHLLYSLITDSKFYGFLTDNGVDVENMRSEVLVYLQKRSDIPTSGGRQPVRTSVLERVLQTAVAQTVITHRTNVESIDLFISILKESETKAYYYLLKYAHNYEELIKSYANAYMSKKAGRGEMTEKNAQSILDEYCTNLNKQVEEGKIGRIIGRERETEDTCQTLARKTKSNVLLIGDAGVGKTAIVEGLAYRIVNGDVPEYLEDWTIYNMDIGSMVAGSKFRGEFEEKVKDVIDAVKFMGKAILFIDEAHGMRGAGGGAQQGGTDLANMLKPALGRGEIKVIASTTWDEFSQSFEKDRALMRRFNRITVGEPSPEDSVEILMGIREYYEEHHQAKRIKADAIAAAVYKSVRYQPDKKLPDKAIDLIDSACAKKRVQGIRNFIIREGDILAELSKMTGIPLDQMDEKETTEFLDLETKIKAELFGQEDAVKEVLDSIYVAKANMKAVNKPIGSFMFLGPTGVGKTELAKLISKHLKMKLARFDMSEYMEKHAVSRLIGSPPGYVGYDDGTLGGGMLIKEIEQNPHLVLLLDEVEKAHPDVLNILLQLMDEGFVTSGNGKKVDGRNILIIMTSNLGAAANDTNTIGFGGDLSKSGEEDTAYHVQFPPEFRNRVDAVCKFNKLNRSSMEKIVLKFLNELNSLVAEKSMKIVPTDEAISQLIKKGFDEKMGGRPLARTIHKYIKVPLAKKILFEKLSDNINVNVDYKNGEFTFNIIQKEKSKIEVNENETIGVNA